MDDTLRFRLNAIIALLLLILLQLVVIGFELNAA